MATYLLQSCCSGVTSIVLWSCRCSSMCSSPPLTMRLPLPPSPIVIWLYSSTPRSRLSVSPSMCSSQRKSSPSALLQEPQPSSMLTVHIPYPTASIHGKETKGHRLRHTLGHRLGHSLGHRFLPHNNLTIKVVRYITKLRRAQMRAQLRARKGHNLGHSRNKGHSQGHNLGHRFHTRNPL